MAPKSGTATSESGAEGDQFTWVSKAAVWHSNVTSQESIETVPPPSRARFGNIDILINNAGITCDNR